MQIIRGYSQGALSFPKSVNRDRVGVVASVLCAIHCALTPLLLLFLPVFGKVWSHPASHWLMALLVVPLAVVTVRAGYQRHGRKWVVASAALGIFFVLIGAAAPNFEEAPEAAMTHSAPLTTVGNPETAPAASCSDSSCSLCASNETSSDAEVASAGKNTPASSVLPSQEPVACTDSCCPSLQTAEDGSWSLHIPLASVLTTIGGALLILTHIGNLCRCSCCETEVSPV